MALGVVPRLSIWIFTFQKFRLEVKDVAYNHGLEERLAWFCRSQYPYPVNFQKEIDGTVYKVNTHFNAAAFKSIQEKAEHILLKL